MTLKRISLLLLLAAATLHSQEPKRLVVIDQDANGPGNSSMESMLMLLDDPAVQVLGITIESGDGWQKESVVRTLRMLELTHHTDVPVFAGATYPLVNTQAATRRWEQMYGKWGYKGAWTDPSPTDNGTAVTAIHGPDVVPTPPEGLPTIHAAAEPAAVFLTRIVHEHPHEVSILALGPVTNLALAQRLDESFAALAKDLFFMAGSFSPPLTHNDAFSLELLDQPRMAFNMRWDPEAAQAVLHAPWPHITLISEDATFDIRFTPELMQQIAAAAGPSAHYIATYGTDRFPMWDDDSAAIWLDPTLITKSRTMAVDVDLDHGANYGATLSWSAEQQPHLGEPTVTTVLAIDATRTRKLFLDLTTGQH
jgi:inosine-uridine nucleoside N-ribohydrolase